MESKKTKTYCVRCESLDRPMKGKLLYKVKNHFGDEVPMCSFCLEEIVEEEEYFKEVGEDESGSEEFD